MKTLGNILWLILLGWELFLIDIIYGIVCCVTIIFIPVGIVYFKTCVFSLWPFGKDIVYSQETNKQFLNILWVILFGWWNSLSLLLAGCLLCITVIGIPFGLQVFKLAKFFLMPFGATVVDIDANEAHKTSQIAYPGTVRNVEYGEYNGDTRNSMNTGNIGNTGNVGNIGNISNVNLMNHPKFCRQCGSPIKLTEKYCRTCGRPIYK